MDTTKGQFGKLATSPEEMAQNRANLQQNLSSLGTPSSIVGGSVVPTTITADILKSSPTPLKLPEQQTPTTADGLIGSVTSANEQMIKQLEADKLKTEKAKTESGADLRNIINQQIGILGSRATEEANANLPKLREDVTAIANEIDSVQRAYQNELKALDSSNMTDAGRAAASRDISRKYASQLADLSIVQNARNRNLTTAQANVDRKIELQLEPLKLQLDYQKSVYEDNKDSFTKADDRRYQALIKNSERELDKEEERLKTLENIKKDIRNKAIDSGADNQTLLNIERAKSGEEVIKAAGNLTGDTTYKELPDGRAVMLDKRGNITKIISSEKTTPSIILSDTDIKDEFIQKLAKTAGGKPLTDTFAQKLDKGLTVLNQIGTLQTNIKDVKTGPIIGAFRGANPWDTNAQTIKAQLNAIVPNLARGVYGEVGVLTDNDIAQYSKTLPNLKSTEDIRNAVLGITVDLIGKSIKRTLEVNAANKKDVSGFIDLYKEMKDTRDSIFSQIPGYQGELSSKDNPFSTAINGTQTSNSIISNDGGYNIPNK